MNTYIHTYMYIMKRDFSNTYNCNSLYTRKMTSNLEIISLLEITNELPIYIIMHNYPIIKLSVTCVSLKRYLPR